MEELHRSPARFSNRGHPLLDDDADRYHVLSVLRSGTPLLLTNATMNDVVDPGLGSVVPKGVRTDGTWFWSDAVIYSLEGIGWPRNPGC